MAIRDYRHSRHPVEVNIESDMFLGLVAAVAVAALTLDSTGSFFLALLALVITWFGTFVLTMVRTMYDLRWWQLLLRVIGGVAVVAGFVFVFAVLLGS